MNENILNYMRSDVVSLWQLSFFIT